MSIAHGAQINFGDKTPYLTYGARGELCNETLLVAYFAQRLFLAQGAGLDCAQLPL